jgi:hypothetical protein
MDEEEEYMEPDREYAGGELDGTYQKTVSSRRRLQRRAAQQFYANQSHVR